MNPKLILPIFCMGYFNCTTKTITIESSPDASISLVNPGSLDEVGEVIGSGKADLNVKRLSDKFIKVSAPNRFSQTIIVTDTLGVNTKMNVLLKEVPKPVSDSKNPTPQNQPQDQGPQKANESSKQDIKVMNLTSRLLLKSYQALSKGNYQAARDIASKVSEITPTLAGTHLLIGLSFLKEGKKNEANSSFIKAKALDPEDIDIDKLIKISQ